MLYMTQEMLEGQSTLMLYWAFVVAGLEAEPWALYMLHMCPMTSNKDVRLFLGIKFYKHTT